MSYLDTGSQASNLLIVVGGLERHLTLDVLLLTKVYGFCKEKEDRRPEVFAFQEQIVV